ncbi:MULTISPECIES: DUF6397 family protein [Streptomyces]|uniref:Uncharacterized protein n=2 Tax=Streptomyces TaxID=1883 RepID=A0A8H9HC61_9ACTN|nr:MULTISPECIES: DUF6397 family protein [Streptomyces]RPK87976.1 hypothetical protein EES47_15860 [Streptomyces sp. ADI98-12]WPR54175.1 DUF6397 family protein [Streptomyces sp. S399]SUP60398.1 Uncharacterised protein [Streptomyces griseus]GFH68805.1 hypothetical protein Srut_53190 [Streptomyces rutgersensis]GFH79438.1 hypothetical protein Sgou_41080 [Streptomyces gougerotii]
MPFSDLSSAVPAPRAVPGPDAAPWSAPPEPAGPVTLSAEAAARALGLRQSEVETAVGLGLLATTRGTGRPGERPKVPAGEIRRLHGSLDGPDGLRAQVATTGARDGAALLGITEERFAKLARLGLLVPVRCRLNRYHCVVWRYLAEELRTVRRHQVVPLTGQLPAPLRRLLATGDDARPRSWRRRVLSQRLDRAGTAWERAAAVAALLPRPHPAALLTPDELRHLEAVRPRALFARARSRTAERVLEPLTRALPGPETERYAGQFAGLVDEARATAHPAQHAVRRPPRPARLCGRPAGSVRRPTPNRPPQPPGPGSTGPARKDGRSRARQNPAGQDRSSRSSA